MTRFGFHASHEQIGPRELLEAAQLAEQAGAATSRTAAAGCGDGCIAT